MHQDKIWESYQNDAELAGMGCPGGGRLNYIAKRVPLDCRVLTIGVGDGTLEGLLVKKGLDVSCLDPSQTSIERLRSQHDMGEKAKVGYSQCIPFPDSAFDYVIMTEVLEHLSDTVLEETLIEVRRVLEAGGQFIGSVPADEDLKASLVICPHCGERFHRWGHVQSFTKDRLEQVLSRYFGKLAVKRVVFANFRNLNWKGKVSWALKAAQASLGIKGSNQNFYFEANKN